MSGEHLSRFLPAFSRLSGLPIIHSSLFLHLLPFILLLKICLSERRERIPDSLPTSFSFIPQESRVSRHHSSLIPILSRFVDRTLPSLVTVCLEEVIDMGVLSLCDMIHDTLVLAALEKLGSEKMVGERRRSGGRNESISDPQILKDYPLDVFPNWNINTEDLYYVKAPLDRLGDTAFHIRTHITSLILSGNTATVFIQSFANPLLTRLAFAFSQLGLELFIISVAIIFTWLFDARLGRLLTALLALCFFISSSLKVLLCLPRPPAPPALRLSEEDHDWAWPSNHALVGTALPWFIWLYSSSNYDLSFSQSFLLLVVLFTWNVGIAWSRIYLGVHSPCDVLGGWTIGVLTVFVFGGFSMKLYAWYTTAVTVADYSWIFLGTGLLLVIHPRAWPETQSYGETLSVLCGNLFSLGGRYFRLGSNEPFVSLAESNSEAAIMQYVLRMIVGVFMILLGRILLKRLCLAAFSSIYSSLGLKFYSYTEMCKRLDSFEPTKRFTTRMRFRPIPNGKQEPSSDQIPYDIDVPVKIVVYSFAGFMIQEGCPFLFQIVGI